MTNQVYGAVYSGVAVYELMCRNVAVMRRKGDSYLNATQILKVAGVDKGRRTKILEKEVQIGEHEKVQGGYGKYQGTWIPFERGVEVARQYGVDELLRPLFDYVGGPGEDEMTPKKPIIKKVKPPKPVSQPIDYDDPPTTRRREAAEQGGYYQVQPVAPVQYKPPPNSGERYRATLMSIFLGPEGQKVPEILTKPSPPSDLDIDLILDDQGHTALHWAAALARINIIQLLLNAGADPRRVNFNGENALIRAVLVTNNFDNDTFFDLLTLLHSAIDVTDKKGRSVFHHIALTSGIKGRLQACRYYLDTLIEMIQKASLDLNALIDLQDKHGDTALNIATRVGNKVLVEQLIRYGADPTIANKSGIRPKDFALVDPALASVLENLPSLQNSNSNQSLEGQKNQDSSAIKTLGNDRSMLVEHPSASNRSKEMHGEYETVVANLEDELKSKDVQLKESLSQIKTISKELSNCRRVVHQLSTRVGDLEHKKKFYEKRLNVNVQAEAEEINDVVTLQKEVAKLKAILKAHNVPAEEFDDSQPIDIVMNAEADESKVSRLFSKILDDKTVSSLGGNLVDSLLTAVSSEKNIRDPKIKSFMKRIENDGDEMDLN